MKSFVIAAPCAKCPFRRDVPIYLRLDRRREIVQSVLVDGSEFWCHNTTDLEGLDEADDYVTRGGEKVCAGAARMVDEAGGSTQLMRIAERLGEDLDLDRGAAIWSVEEFTTLAEGSVGGATSLDPEVEQENETCCACLPGCLAPAGYLGIGGAVVRGMVGADGNCEGCGEACCSNCADDEGFCPDCSEYEEDEAEG